MKFWEAMKALEEGERVRCKEWRNGQWISKDDESDSLPSLHLSCLLREEWELYEETEKRLSFSEVVKGLKEGKKYRRLKDSISMCACLMESIEYTGTGLARGFFLEDFEATDWIEVK